MLISKEVEILVSGQNKRHYENLGYEIPKYKDDHYRWAVKKGTRIIVKVEDLPKGSQTKIQVKCDYCGKIFEKSYDKYIKQRNSIKTDACYNCRHEKNKDVFKEKYGLSWNSQLQSVRNKISEANQLDSEIVIRAFKDRGLTIVENPFIYKNSHQRIHFICNKHPQEGVQTTYYDILHQGGSGCKKCRYDKISGENCYMWKGGISPIHTFLRDKIRKWKQDSMIKSKYKCCITGTEFHVIHHVYGFNQIIQETMKILQLPIKQNINEYTEYELKQMESKCLELHYKYGLGICLNEDIHRLYHGQYYRQNASYEDFEEFKQRYYKGEFDNKLKEELKSYNSMERVRNMKEAI
ncbi:hypothetical protein IRP63_14855 (plasmid) [Clostridium botulinum]|uniref:hypothetical protein n=1 Tax=Clostridium botulinum TaxID=1491 RepID=UPI0004D47080|nr:hypothetical protein [Clostridium botulinum]KEH99858.1 hypothetical protein Z952_p0189 [Clostridium botulinum C/D str. BKT75002]KEI05336.1 hypothetical protein Z954_0190 [Clostridium botulinum C/D str. BKT2873]MCD3232664.1 hypothetical protein [Clostridium botulinum D/C]MCD3238407.1 hypothetical protein [Clostridium botulinum D/C]MCD3266073.1 hypothetical protein [Clostridium botulinum D/C]